MKSSITCLPRFPGKNDAAAKDNSNKPCQATNGSGLLVQCRLLAVETGTIRADRGGFKAVLERSPADEQASRCFSDASGWSARMKANWRATARRIKTAFEDSAYRQLQAELKARANDTCGKIRRQVLC